MAEQNRDPELLARLEALYPAVVSDELDKMGYRHQAMRPDIRPLYPEARICGYAHTVLCAQAYSMPEEPYKMELAAVDAVQDHDIICVSPVEGSFWGELLSTAARYRGCQGIVVDGYTRDTLQLMEMKFPTFVRGIHMADSMGRLEVVEFGVPIECGDVRMKPGDMLLGDYDGIIVIPQEVTEEAITRAEEKVRGENTVRDHLAQGMPVTEAFRRFGIM